MKKQKTWLSVLAIVCILGLLIWWYIADTPYRQAERLIEAIEAEDVDKVRQMLESGVDPDGLTASETMHFLLGFVESGARRPISEACAGDNVEIVRLLLEYGASPNDHELTDWNPVRSVLHQYQETDLEMLQLLVSYGADTTYREKGEPEPVFVAAKMWPTTKGEYEEEKAKGITELVIYLLGDRSVNINGSMLLYDAALFGNLYLVEYLLDHGSEIPAGAYWEAKTRGYTEIAELLKP